MKSFYQYLNEVSIERTERIITGLAHDVATIGIMTPTDPETKRFPNRLNKSFVSQFLDYLRSNGYDPIQLGGKFDGNQETSFLIKNISKRSIITLSKMYDQESVIWGRKVDDGTGIPRFHYEYIKNGRTTMTSDQLNLNTQKQDDYSTIKGRQFTIPFRANNIST